MAKNLSNYLPNEYFKSIFSIDYHSLFNKNFDTIFFDLDNTIADYNTSKPSNDIVELINRIKSIGFKIYILSNNHKNRLNPFLNDLNVRGQTDLGKPFIGKINKLIKENNINKDKILFIGDQLMTDTKCAKKLGVYNILIDPIKQETEKWYTRINRFFERKKLKSIKNNLYDYYMSIGLNERVI